MPQGKSLSVFLVDLCSKYECPEAGLADLLTTQLKEGNCLLLLGGLDEIVGADERLAVVRQIEAFVDHYDDVSNSFVITSRIAGYRNARLSGAFVHYSVQEMDEAQIQRFLEVWCPAEARAAVARGEIDARLLQWVCFSCILADGYPDFCTSRRFLLTLRISASCTQTS